MLKPTPTIMVIEDEELLQEAITRKLQNNGITVISFRNGKQALDYLVEAIQLPDAIWLDYYLKDMNGLEFMQGVKQNPKLANIPVIVVSNSANLEKVHNMLALGAKKYLLKADYRLEEIIHTILEIIEKKDASSHQNSY